MVMICPIEVKKRTVKAPNKAEDDFFGLMVSREALSKRGAVIPKINRTIFGNRANAIRNRLE